jgi:5-methylcytosine-specific restriction endonuclease McrA
MTAKYRYLKENNLCTICGTKPSIEGILYCDECRTKENLRNKVKIKKLKDAHLCLACGKPVFNLNRIKCPDCLKRYSQEQKDRNNKRRNEGLCIYCGIVPHIAGYMFCNNCRIKVNIQRKKREKKLSDEGLCIYCKTPATIRKINKLCEDCWFKDMSGKSTGSRKNWKAIKDLFYKQNCKCFYTGRKLIPGINASLDHIVPKSKNGSNNINNLQWLDLSINLMKRNMTHDEFISIIKLVVEYSK